MKIISSTINDLYIIEPQVFEDSRGYFFESYNKLKLEEQNMSFEFVQDNQSKSSYGVLRGLHFQKSPYSQSKLVRVLDGSIFDVAVDCRPGSSTFGKWFGLELSSANKKQLLIPKGFAHGFSVLSETAIVLYKCDEYYSPDSDSGILYNDPTLNIDWKIPADKVIVSEKDKKQPTFNEAKINFN